MKPRILVAFQASACLVLSCSSDPYLSAQDSGPMPELGSDRGNIAEPDSDGDCDSAIVCAVDKVCNPATRTCVQDLSCAHHEDCGHAAYCDGDTCRRSETGSPCAGDASCIPGEVCVGGFCGCQGQSYTAQVVAPNMLIVLDRSGSMDFAIEAGTKWTVAQEAIAHLLAAHSMDIRFGLALYPGTNADCIEGSSCSPGAVWVDPGPNTAQQISTTLAQVQTCVLGTPTAEMLSALLSYAGIADTTRDNYVLLVTDGNSTCDNPAHEAADLLALTPKVKTYVVGFGSLVSGMELDDIAKSGGTADPNRPHDYFEAEDGGALTAALSAIAGQVLSCVYTLSDDPADLNKLFVYQQKQPVARDASHKDGWDYDTTARQLTFFGPACDGLRLGAVSDLVIVYGCPLVLK